MNLDCAQFLMVGNHRSQLVMTEGRGSYLWDDRGRKFLDLVQGWATNSLGHAPSEIVRALAEQAAKLWTPSPSFYNEPQLRLAQRLCAWTSMAQVQFGSTGAEATEMAIQLARKWGQLHRRGAYEILTARGSFHGRSLAAMAASGKAGWDAMYLPHLEGFTKVDFGDLEAARRAISARTIAIMVEPIQGECGVVVPPPGYLAALRALCDESGVLLIFDEIQTGMGRTGRHFAWQHEGARPDILMVGKGLGGGFPISAVLATSEASCFVPGDAGGTFQGNPLATSVALAVMDVFDSAGFMDEVRARASELERGLRGLAARHHLEVRGRGLLWALVLPRPCAQQLAGACFEGGLLVNPLRPHIVRLMPSLRISSAEIAEAMACLDRSLTITMEAAVEGISLAPAS